MAKAASELVRPRIDIKLRPSGLVRTRTDIKLRPSGLVRTKQVAANWIGKIIQGLMQEQIKYTCKFFKIVIWPLFKVTRGHTKKRPNDNFKKFACIFNLLLHQSLYDLTNPIGGNLLCSYQSTWPQLDISSCSYQSTWPQFDISPCSYQSTWPQLDINSWSYLFTCSFGRRLISALVLTSHLKCQTTPIDSTLLGRALF